MKSQRPQLARRLALKNGTQLVRIETLRLADRTPICVGTTWLASDRFPDAGRVYERAGSMTKMLAHFGIRDYRRATTHVSAGIVEATDATRLDLPLGRPVLIVDSTDVDASGKSAADHACPLRRRAGRVPGRKQLTVTRSRGGR